MSTTEPTTDRLTRLDGRKRALVAVAALLLLALLAAGLVVSLDFIAARKHTDQVIIDNGLENRRHVDCVVAILYRREPPICGEVKRQLIREGILPPELFTTSTTSTTTVP